MTHQDRLTEDISQMNFSRTIVHSEEVITATDEVLIKYLRIQDQLGLISPMNELRLGLDLKQPGKMHSNRIIQGEIDAGLWEKAVLSATLDVTQTHYCNVNVVQKIISYVLNVYSSTDLGLAANFFNRLILFHPPSRAEMGEYYRMILTDHYVTLYENGKEEEENIFWCLIDNLTACAKKKDNIVGVDELQVTTLNQNINEGVAKLKNYFSDDKTEKTVSKVQTMLNEKEVIYFDELCEKEKIKRCLVCFKFIYDILEIDFVNMIDSKQLKIPSFSKTYQPLLAELLWEEPRDIGIVNKKVQKILFLQQKFQGSSCSQSYLLDKLVWLTAELIRWSDANRDPVFPFLGNLTNSFARKISLLILERFNATKNENGNLAELTVHLRPTWLRLLVVTHLLNLISGSDCLPELVTVVDVLYHFSVMHFDEEKDVSMLDTKEDENADPALIKKFKKLKSVNAKLVSGKTRLHEACRKDKLDEVKALLTFPELDLNARDNDGFTALHDAAFKGSESCLRELLEYCPPLGEYKKTVDARARGRESYTPLMCAVSNGHAEICRILLEHSGSVLLEDITDYNETPMDLTDDPEILRILNHYKVNVLLTKRGHKKLHFAQENVDVIAQLCVQMVQSYLATHRTWDVYHALKRKVKTDFNLDIAKKYSQIRFNYLRYHRDIKTNIEKLRKLTSKIKDRRELKTSIEPLTFILSLNKFQ